MALLLILLAIILFSVPASGFIANFLLGLGILCVALGIIIFVLVVLEQYAKGKAE